MSRKLAILAGVASFALAPAASATVVTFAQYTQQSTAVPDQTFTVASDGLSASFVATDPSVGDPVYFSFEDLAGLLPASLLTPQTAYLKINGGAESTTAAAASEITIFGTPFLVQPRNEPFTLSFIRSSDYIYDGHDYGTDLLTVTIAPGTSAPVLIAGQGAPSASLSFDNTNNDVTFSSGFLSFEPGSAEGGAIAYSGAAPAFSLGPKFLNDFRVDSTGTFDANPVPVSTLVPVPEPASVAVLGIALLGLGMVRRGNA